MGTRCVTIAYDETGREVARHYRNYDGYPSGHGADLGRMLVDARDESPDDDALTAAYLREMGEFESETPGTEHADIEYLYAVRLGHDPTDTSVSAWTTIMGEPYEQAMSREPLASGTPEEFLDAIGASVGNVVTIGVIRPHEMPVLRRVDLDDTDDEGHGPLQRLVGGWLETFDVLCLGTDATMYVNEEGVLRGLEPNRAVYATREMAQAGYLSQTDLRTPVREGDLYTVLFGTIVVVAHDDDGEPRDLDPTTFHKVAAQFFDEASLTSAHREVVRLLRTRHG